MTGRTLEALADIDPREPVEIADRIWWVGHRLEGDPFQCHTYLIEHGDQSVLIDPGSKLTFKETFRKVDTVVGFANVRYFLCHHQDPDITGAMNIIAELVDRPDACVVTHWRAQTLLKHLGLPLRFWLIDQNEWRLDIGGRTLEFVFTPYMHFAGAFCTFDRATGVLFSSDIFGGFTEEWSLVARDESYFEAIRPFHEHYIPSREIMIHGLTELERFPIELIAPQHGCLIPNPLIPFMFEKLKSLDCGLYLTARDHSDIFRLLELNRRMRKVMNTMVLYRDFREVARALLELVQSLLPAVSLEFYASWGTEHALYLGPHNRYRGIRVQPPDFCRGVLGGDARAVGNLGEVSGSKSVVLEHGDTADLGKRHPAVLVPLTPPDRPVVDALAVVLLEHDVELSRDARQALEEIKVPLQVAIERERIYRLLETERSEIYEVSIRDPLTKLYTRLYVQECAPRFLDMHDRDESSPVALVMLDLDHFKAINDTHGHIAGDQVLRAVGEVLLRNIRESDIPVRFGGEEFAVLLAGRSAMHAERVAERIRQEVTMMPLEKPLHERRVTISGGVAVRRQRESRGSLLERADAALYRAKRAGRNRITIDDPNASERETVEARH